MILIKKVFGIVYEFMHSFDPISHIFLFMGSVAAGGCYAAAYILITFWQNLFTDYETAFYWSGELLHLAIELLGASFIPVLLFEIILIFSGTKIKEK